MKNVFKRVSKKFGGSPRTSTKKKKPEEQKNQVAATSEPTSRAQHIANISENNHRLRRTASYTEQTVNAMEGCPSLKDSPVVKRPALFLQKLKLCEVLFNFEDPSSEQRGKELKRNILLELVDYVNTSGGGGKVFNAESIPAVVSMVGANIFRTLPARLDDYDPEEDEPVLEAAWPHLQVVYEFLLRFVVSSDVTAKVAKKHVNQRFCLNLIDLFDSEDPRERDYLKTILHRVYGKFMSHRAFIRRTIANAFYTFVYETEMHNGVGELLEILGSIINGFALPLKKEHLRFMEKALTPLHKPACVGLYHQQLSYCITQYVEKDPNTGIPIILGLTRFWPWTCSNKQVMFLNELEEILELIMPEQLETVHGPLFNCIARCVGSPHFQVAERTLFLWNNEHLVNVGCLSKQHAPLVLPAVYPALYRNTTGHWNSTVEGLTQNVLTLYKDYDEALYDKCQADYLVEESDRETVQAKVQGSWAALTEEFGGIDLAEAKDPKE